MESEQYEFDVALSFAGEQRYYVDIVATELERNGIKLFYDEKQKPEMWGEYLPDYLSGIYSEKALYCLMFISKEYVSKMWTNHERKSAISRAIRQKEEYILPSLVRACRALQIIIIIGNYLFLAHATGVR